VPLDSPTPAKSEAINDGLFQGLIQRFSESDRASFTDRQLRALETACQNVAWGRHAVDIRLSIPAIFSRFYIVFLMGRERRSAKRRSEEKRRHPLSKVLNTLLVGGLIAVGIYLIFFIQTLLFIVFYSDGIH
jgi:hypothetical protein